MGPGLIVYRLHVLLKLMLCCSPRLVLGLLRLGHYMLSVTRVHCSHLRLKLLISLLCYVLGMLNGFTSDVLCVLSCLVCLS